MHPYDRKANHLLILAGGEATRLGPLTANLNKGLVSLGQKPVMVRQILDMKIKHVTIVANEQNVLSVQSMISRSGLDAMYDVRVIGQPTHRRGPGGALYTGLFSIHDRFDHAVSPIVLFADTLFNPALIDGIEHDDFWVGLGIPNDRDRSWCYRSDNGMWTDGKTSNAVFIGAFQLPFVNDDLLREISSCVQIPTALNNFEHHFETACDIYINNWTDTGDIKALASATRETFLSRGHHSLSISQTGVLTKHTEPAEIRFYRNLPRQLAPLFPAVYNYRFDSVDMEYIGLPSLAELWLYWPGKPEMWTEIVSNVIETLAKYMWPLRRLSKSEMADRCFKMYIDKTNTRIINMRNKLNDEDFVFMCDLLNKADKLVLGGVPGFIHGDLNFGNILYSLNTGTFRLIDPRGEWGDTYSFGDTRYELAKLRYSYRGFCAITHGLFDRDKLGPNRVAELAELDKLLGQYADLDELNLIEALLLVSAIPLHPRNQQEMLIRQAKAAINGE